MLIDFFRFLTTGDAFELEADDDDELRERSLTFDLGFRFDVVVDELGSGSSNFDLDFGFNFEVDKLREMSSTFN